MLWDMYNRLRQSCNTKSHFTNPQIDISRLTQINPPLLNRICPTSYEKSNRRRYSNCFYLDLVQPTHIRRLKYSMARVNCYHCTWTKSYILSKLSCYNNSQYIKMSLITYWLRLYVQFPALNDYTLIHSVRWMFYSFYCER